MSAYFPKKWILTHTCKQSRLVKRTCASFLVAMCCATFSTSTYADILPTPDLLKYNWEPQSSSEGRFVVKLDQDGRWTKLQNQTIRWTVRLKLPGQGTHLKVAKFYLQAAGDESSPYGTLKYTISSSEHSTMFQDLHGGDPVQFELSGTSADVFDQTAVLKTPEQFCSNHRSRLLSQGMELYTVLSNDWTLKYAAISQARLDFKLPLFSGKYYDYSYVPRLGLPMDIKCKGDAAIAAKVAPLVATLDPDALPQVDNASLTLIEQYGRSGVCKVKLSGVVQTNFKNTKVRFRYEHTGGEKSEIHEVTTDHAKTAMFAHDYDIPNKDGPEGGAIRMIGVQPEFESDWQNYSMDCTDPATTDFTAVLPPKLSMDVVTEETDMISGQICPTKLRLIGRLEGRGPFEGQAAFVGDNYLSAPEPYEINHGENKFIVAFRDVKWSGPSGPSMQTTAPPSSDDLRSQTIQVGLNVTSGPRPSPANKVVASIPRTPKKITCKFPQVNATFAGSADEMTAAPKPVTNQPSATMTSESSNASEPAEVELVTMVKPDLQIERIIVPKQNNGKLKAIVVNTGQAASTPTKLRAETRKKTRRTSVPALSAGERKTVEIDFGAPIKAKSVKFNVDPKNKVEESNENNNRTVYEK